MKKKPFYSLWKALVLTGFVVLTAGWIAIDGTGKPGFLADKEEFGHLLERNMPVWMDRYKVPGVIVALIRNGEHYSTNAWGYADLEDQTRMLPQTICRVESISKSVTARGVMKLAESGKIRLDDPVIKHIHSWEFPETGIKMENVTIRQLLSHTSGLQLGTLGLEYIPGQVKPSLREALTNEVRFVQEPGTSFLYSNVGFNLLELMIEDVSERNFADYMREEILIPSGMQTADFEWRDDFPTAVPDGHTVSGESVPVYVYSEKGAGGLFANAEDLARFVSSGMLNGFYKQENALSQNSIRELYSPETEVAGIYVFAADRYGLGHFIETLPDGRSAVFGGGQGHGWMTHFHMVPDSGDGIVILTNSSRSWPLLSRIMTDWAAWNGYGSVGMAIITKAAIGFRVIIAFILAGALFFLVRMGHGFARGYRRLNLKFRVKPALRITQIALSVLLAFALIWGAARDYLTITAIFPGESPWFATALALVSGTLMVTALVPPEANNVTVNHNEIDSKRRNSQYS
jgi:CubicO group peptidase (beta-lactamase class C family)